MKKNIQNKYNKKSQNYFSNKREDILSCINGNNLKILDIGCGYGYTLRELKKTGKAALTVGIDISKQLFEKSEDFIDKAIIGDIEDIEPDLEKNYFDVIIFADVLEHLIEPKAVLKKMKSYLKDQGIIIVSLPNFRELKVLYKIFLKGDFRYENSGILDYTHLRFFCKRNMVELINENYKIIGIKMANTSKLRCLINKVSFGVFEEFILRQYIIIAENN